MNIITLLPDTPFLVNDNLTVKVLYILEMWLPPNRRSVIEVNLEFWMDGKKGQVSFNSDEPHFACDGYEFEYLGGWRDEVKLKLIKTKDGH
jgi:hypothetical protein